MNTNQLTEGIIADERFTPATIRQIRMAAIPPSCLAKKALEGYTAILEPNRVPGISNKTVLQCVKRGQQGPAYVSRSVNIRFCHKGVGTIKPI